MNKKWMALLVGALQVSLAWAGAADDIQVDNPYVRLVPASAPATGAFMVLNNKGNADIKLVKASNPATKQTELHTHINDNGVMRMREVKDIEIKAKSSATLQPGGLHVMLIGFVKELTEGQMLPITLTFQDGSSKTIEAKVTRPMPMGGMGMQHGMEHKH